MSTKNDTLGFWLTFSVAINIAMVVCLGVQQRALDRSKATSGTPGSLRVYGTGIPCHVTVNADQGYEFSGTGSHWSSSRLCVQLDGNTDETFMVRKATGMPPTPPAVQVRTTPTEPFPIAQYYGPCTEKLRGYRFVYNKNLKKWAVKVVDIFDDGRKGHYMASWGDEDRHPESVTGIFWYDAGMMCNPILRDDTCALKPYIRALIATVKRRKQQSDYR